MRRRLRLLVVSHAFPPIGEVGSLRIAHLCHYLRDYNVEPIVLTLQEKFYDNCDETFGGSADVRVLRTTMMRNPLYWYEKLRKSLRSSSPGSVPIRTTSIRRKRDSFLRKHILALMQFPDREVGWYWPAIRVAGQFLRTERVDAMLSSGPPWIAHLIARRLKEKFAIPWLADFRDPWVTLMPVREPHWKHTLSERLEAGCFRFADLVVCNTDRLSQGFRQHYPKLDPEKFRTLTNGYENLSIPSNQQKHSKRLLLHLGSLYGPRRIDTFLTALSALVAAQRLSPQSFQVTFQGDTLPRFEAEAAKIVPELLQSKCIEFRPRQKWKDSLNVLWRADLLLLFCSRETEVPAKFYEYLQTGIPIFAVAEEGALTDVLKATKSGISAPAGDSRVIAERLAAALELPKRSPKDVRDRFSRQYHYSALAGQLAQWIDGLTIDHYQRVSSSNSSKPPSSDG